LQFSLLPSVELSPFHDADLFIQKATYSGDVTQLAILVSSDVNARSIYGIIPLQLAVRAYHAETVRILLAAGADPNLEDRIETCYYVPFNAISGAA
jgi:ankyrin repeat protein